MCGIVGYRTRASTDDAAIGRLLDSQGHRGRDHRAVFRQGLFVGAYNRLSLQGGRAGEQPFRDGARTLFFNGEIYNHRELREELRARGIAAEGEADGAVILPLLALYGSAAFTKLDGMFALAIWCEETQRLILARDAAGEKPLYFSKLGYDEVLFASELGAFRASPLVKAGISRQAVRDFLSCQWVPEPFSIYQGVQAVPPGHAVEVDAHGLRYRAFPAAAGSQLALSDEEAASLTRHALEEAVSRRAGTDLPIGSFLSGGIDSSLVSLLAARARPDLHTFSVGFEEIRDELHGAGFDESVFAGEVARKIGSRHHRILLGEEEFHWSLRRLAGLSQPFANPASLGVLLVGREAERAGIRILLSGDGSDESFGGYPWHLQLETIERLRFEGKTSAGTDPSFLDVNVPFAERLAQLAHLDAPQRALAFQYIASEKMKSALLHPDLMAGTLSTDRLFQGVREGAPDEFTALDRDFFSHNENLRRSDLMLMQFTIEGRAPFAAGSVLALSRRLGHHQKVRNGSGKYILKRAFADLLPPEVLAKPKHGFTVPVGHWLKGGSAFLVKETFATGSPLRKLGIFRPDAEQNFSALPEGPRKELLLYSLVVLDGWLRAQEG